MRVCVLRAEGSESGSERGHSGAGSGHSGRSSVRASSQVKTRRRIKRIQGRSETKEKQDPGATRSGCNEGPRCPQSRARPR